MRRLLAALLFLALPGAAHAALDVLLTVTEPAGVARSAEYDSWGVPLAEGETITAITSLRLTQSNGSTAVPAQFDILSRWGGPVSDTTKPIKWVLVTCQTTVGANASVTYHLKDGGSGNAAGDMTLTDGALNITVDTGAGGAKFQISKAHFNLADYVWTDQDGGGTRNDLIVSQPTSGGFELVDAYGTLFTSMEEAPEVITIEENGPLRKVIYFSGVFRSATGDYFAPARWNSPTGFYNINPFQPTVPPHSFTYYTCRLYFYSGSPIVRAVFALENRGTMAENADEKVTPQPITFDSLTFKVNLDGMSSPSVTMQGLAATPISGSDEVSLKQRWNEDTTRENGYAAVALESVLTASFANGPTHTITKAGVTQSTGTTNAGWLDLKEGARGLSFAMRDFWQNWPKENRITSSELAVELWPSWGYFPFRATVRDINQTHRLQGGRAKSFETQLAFSATANLGPALDAALSNPLFAAATPERYWSTRAVPFLVAPPLGHVAHLTGEMAEAVTRWDRWGRCAVDPTLALNNDSIFTMQTAASGGSPTQRRFFSWAHWGEDMLWGYTSALRPANHYDRGASYFLHFFRTGDRRFLDLGSRVARHQYDIDHYYGDRVYQTNERRYEHWLFYESDVNGDTSIATDGTWGGKPSHTWNGASAIHYLLTGDRRALDAVNDTVEAVQNYYGTGGIVKAGIASCAGTSELRSIGWPLHMLTYAYLIRGEPSDKQLILDIAGFLHRFEQNQTLGGGYWACVSDNNVPGWDESITACTLRNDIQDGLQIAYIAHPLIMAHYATQDATLKDLIIRAAAMVTTAMVGGFQDTSYKYLGFGYYFDPHPTDTTKATTGGYASFPAFVGDLLAYAYYLSGYPDFLTKARICFRDANFFNPAGAPSSTAYRYPIGIRSFANQASGSVSKEYGWRLRTGHVGMWVESHLAEVPAYTGCTILSTQARMATTTKFYRHQMLAVGPVGATYTWSVSAGSLPTGLSLSEDGTISGIPDQEHVNTNVTFTLRATRVGNPNDWAERQFSIWHDNGSAPTITNATPLPAAVQFTDYYVDLETTGGYPGPVTFEKLTTSSTSQPGNKSGYYTGSLPAGLTLNSSTGVISGQATGAEGVVNFTILASDSLRTRVPKNYSITVVAGAIGTLESIALAATPPAFTAINQTYQLSVIGTYDTQGTQPVTSTATYASSDAAVATVSAGGLITAKGAGAATITIGHAGVSSIITIARVEIGVGTATGIKVTTDRWFDTSTLANFANSAISLFSGATNEEKALAIFRAIQMTTFVPTTSPSETKLGISDVVYPEKVLNVYGAHWCDGLAEAQINAWRAIGGQARKLYFWGHTVADLFYEDADTTGRWHVFDNSQYRRVVWDRTGGHIAGPDELALDRSLVRMPASPLTKAVNLSANPYPSWIHEKHLQGLTDYSRLYNLRLNESVKLYWSNLGATKLYYNGTGTDVGSTDFEHGPYTKTYGNAVWTHQPTVVQTTTLTYNYPYIIADARLSMSVNVPSGSSVAVAVSSDNSTWTTLATYTSSQVISAYDLGTTPDGRYTYYLRLTLTGNATVSGVETTHYTQCNIFSLPMLWPVYNQVTVAGTVPGDTTLRITYNWTDTAGAKTNVAKVVSPPYTYQVEADGAEWADIVCNWINIEAIPRAGGDSNGIVTAEGPAVNTANITPSETFTVYDIITGMPGSAKGTPLSIANAITAINTEVAKTTPVWDTLHNALYSLMTHGAAASPDAVTPIENALKHAKTYGYETKAWAIQALYQVAGSASVPMLRKVLQRHADILGWTDTTSEFTADQVYLASCGWAAHALAMIDDAAAQAAAPDIVAVYATSNAWNRWTEIKWGLLRVLGMLGGVSDVFEDQFTASNGTILTAHASDSGHSWTTDGSSPVITTNSARGSGTVRVATVNSDFAQDGIFSFDLGVLQAGTSGVAGVRFRGSDTERYSLYWSGALQQWVLNKISGGSTDLDTASAVYAPGTYACALTISNGTFSLRVDGELVLEYTDATPLTGGKIGIRLADVGTGVSLDNLVYTAPGDNGFVTLRAAVLANPPTEASYWGAWGLGEVGTAVNVTDLQALISRATWNTPKYYAIEAIGKLGTAAQGASLYAYTSSWDEEFRGRSAEALGRLQALGALTYLTTARATETYPWVQDLQDAAILILTPPEIDTIPPATSGHVPAKSATGVLPNQRTISFHVTDESMGVDVTTISVTVEGGAAQTCGSGLLCTGNPADYLVVYQHGSDWSYSQEVNVTIDASDLTVPAANAMTQDVYSFTVVAEPDPEDPGEPGDPGVRLIAPGGTRSIATGGTRTIQ